MTRRTIPSRLRRNSCRSGSTRSRSARRSPTCRPAMPQTRAPFRVLAVPGPPARAAAGHDRGRVGQAGRPPAERWQRRIQYELGEEIGAHLRADGLAVVEVGAEGITGPERPPCVAGPRSDAGQAPSLSVVIVTRGRPERVLRTILSILDCTLPSGPLRRDRRRHARGGRRASSASRRGRVPEDAHRAGRRRTRAGNLPRPQPRACCEASGEFVVFADDDVDVDPNWLANCLPGSSSGRGSTPSRARPSRQRSKRRPSAGSRGSAGCSAASRPASTASTIHPPTSHCSPSPREHSAAAAAWPSAASLPLASEASMSPSARPRRPSPARTSRRCCASCSPAAGRARARGAGLARPPARVPDAASADVGLRARPQRLPDQVSGRQTPAALGTLLRKLPPGSPSPYRPLGEERNRQGDYPRELIRLELAGLACGPLAYLRSRWQHRGERNKPKRSRSVDERPSSGVDRHRLLPPADRRLDPQRRVAGAQPRSGRSHGGDPRRRGSRIAPGEEDDRRRQVHRVRDLASRHALALRGPLQAQPAALPRSRGAPGGCAAWSSASSRTSSTPTAGSPTRWLSACSGMQVPLLLSARDYGNVCAVGTLVRKGELCSGPAARQVPGLRPRALWGRQGRRRRDRGLFSRPIAAPEGDPRPCGQPLRRRDHRSLPASAGAPATVIPNFHEEDPASSQTRELMSAPAERAASSFSSAASARSRASTSCSRPTRPRRPTTAGPGRDRDVRLAQGIPARAPR